MKFNSFISIFKKAPLALLLLVFSCTNTVKEECRYGDPTPIFSNKNEAVSQTAFSLKDKIGIENVSFKNGVKLELIQQGCNEIKQDFSFILPFTKQKEPDSFWIKQGGQLLKFLANTDLSLAQFGEWAKMIEQRKEEFKLGAPLEVQTGYFITIDKIEGPDDTRIRVILEGK